MGVRVLVSEGTRRMAHQLDDLLDRWRLSKSDDDSPPSILAAITKGDRPKPIAEIKKYVVADSMIAVLADMSWDELRKLHAEAISENNQAKVQIGVFQTQSRDRKDFEWLQQARYIQSVYVSIIQAVQMEFGRRRKTPDGPTQTQTTRKRKRMEYSKLFEREFIEVARAMLPEDTMNRLHDETHKRLAQAGADHLLEKETL